MQRLVEDGVCSGQAVAVSKGQIYTATPYSDEPNYVNCKLDNLFICFHFLIISAAAPGSCLVRV